MIETRQSGGDVSGLREGSKVEVVILAIEKIESEKQGLCDESDQVQKTKWYI